MAVASGFDCKIPRGGVGEGSTQFRLAGFLGRVFSADGFSCSRTDGIMLKGLMEVLHPTRRKFVASSIAAASAMGLAAAQDEKPRIIDAWGHVSLPRFLGAEEFLAILDANGAEAAIVGTAATCPDLRELSRAAVQFGDRLRSIGMPMGRSARKESTALRRKWIAVLAGYGCKRT